MDVTESTELRLDDNIPIVHSLKELATEKIPAFGEFSYYVKYIEKKDEPEVS